MSPSQQEVLKRVIECAKKSRKVFAFSNGKRCADYVHYIDPNLFIQELEKTLEVWNYSN